MRGAGCRLAAVALSLTVAVGLVGCTAPRMARGPVLEERLTDGVYRASHIQFPNRAVVEVTVSSKKITDIRLVSHLALMGRPAEGPVPKRIVESQSTQVDAVTGATNSSKCIMKAVQRAVEQAYTQ